MVRHRVSGVHERSEGSPGAGAFFFAKVCFQGGEKTFLKKVCFPRPEPHSFLQKLFISDFIFCSAKSKIRSKAGIAADSPDVPTSGFFYAQKHPHRDGWPLWRSRKHACRRGVRGGRRALVRGKDCETGDGLLRGDERGTRGKPFPPAASAAVAAAGNVTHTTQAATSERRDNFAAARLPPAGGVSGGGEKPLPTKTPCSTSRRPQSAAPPGKNGIKKRRSVCTLPRCG